MQEDQKCEWCFERAADAGSISVSAQLGKVKPIPVCGQCEPRARRFSAALDVNGFGADCLKGTDWFHNGRPSLVINVDGRPPITIQDGRKLNQKALRGLLPKPPRKARKRKAAKSQAPLSPADRVAAVARRRRELEKDREALDAEVRELVSLAQSEKGITVSGVAGALGLSRQRLYQLAS